MVVHETQITKEELPPSEGGRRRTRLQKQKGTGPGGGDGGGNSGRDDGGAGDRAGEGTQPGGALEC